MKHVYEKTNCENERSSLCANLHLSKENDFWPELAPYKMMIPGTKNCYPAGVRQTKNRMSNCEDLSFFRHTWEKSVYKNLFLVAKRDLSWKMQWYCSATFTIAFFAVKLIFCKDKFTYTMTSFPLSWDDYDLTRLHSNKGLEAILLMGEVILQERVF